MNDSRIEQAIDIMTEAGEPVAIDMVSLYAMDDGEFSAFPEMEKGIWGVFFKEGSFAAEAESFSSLDKLKLNADDAFDSTDGKVKLVRIFRDGIIIPFHLGVVIRKDFE